MSEEKPSDTLLAAAYQVTARWLTNEQQLIWRRTALFITLNSAVVAAVQFLPPPHPWFKVVVPAVGLIYSVCWHFSMKRAWAYQTFLSRMLREQEHAMNLKALGAFGRSIQVMQSTAQHKVAGEDTKIPPRTILFRAELMADATTWLFALVYLGYLVQAVSRINAT
jgi:hypothetical protein